MRGILALAASTVLAFSVGSCSIPLALDWVQVEYDARCSSADLVPASKKVLKGHRIMAEANPLRTGYDFAGWHKEAWCATPWNFDADTVEADTVLYAKWESSAPPSPGQVYSLEFGHASGHNDVCAPMAAPAGGTLFSVWTKSPKILSPSGMDGLVRGNMIVYTLTGENWKLNALVGNVYEYAGKGASYNANYMINAGAVDYVVYQTLERDVLPFETVNDWVWVAWQVVVNADGTITLRQWLKFGMTGKVFAAGPYDPTYTTMSGEEIVAVPGWKAGEAKTFQIGYDNTYSNDWRISNSYLCHARMEARSTRPTLGELEAIAAADAPDPGAWGDWELRWINGAPDLSDRSGNGRHLSVDDGGTLYQGPLSPVF